MSTLETPLLELTAEDFMSQDVLVISQHMTLRYAAHLQAQAEVIGAPVVDEDGRCVGVLSAADLVHWVDRESRPTKRHQEAETCACCDWQLDGMDDAPDDEVSRYMTTNVVATGREPAWVSWPAGCATHTSTGSSSSMNGVGQSASYPAWTCWRRSPGWIASKRLKVCDFY